MNPQAQETNPVINPLNSMQEGEQVIFEVHRHPIGMLGTYFVTGLILLVLAIVIFAAAPALLPDYKGQILKFGSLGFLITLVLVLAFVWATHVIYWGNRWILTTASLTQILQFSLFNKQSSQLSLEDLEDVTAQTNGLLAKMFNFGILKVETAGERSKFTFLFCPEPETYAKKILVAREQYEEHRLIEQRNQLVGSQAGAPAAAVPLTTQTP